MIRLFIPLTSTLCLLAVGCACSEDVNVGAEDGSRPPGVDAGEPYVASDECGNGMDDDLDGIIDEGCFCARDETQSCYSGSVSTDRVGRCARGTQTCAVMGSVEFGNWSECEGDALPAEESCDGTDEDCDGAVDEGCPCRPGETRDCAASAGTRPPCTAGAQACLEDGTWGECEGAVRPVSEICDNGVDDDCDGTVDDPSFCDCRPRPEVCDNGMDDDCDGEVDEPSCRSCTPRAEICGDGLDQDCDGTDPPCVDAGVDAGPDCTPSVCADVPGACGMTDDGCGGTIDCGACPLSCDPTPTELHRAVLPVSIVLTSAMAQIHGTDLYLRTAAGGQHEITRVALDGSGTSVVHRAPFIGDFVTDGTDLYVEGDDSIQVVSTTGGFPSTIFTTPAVADGEAVQGMALTADHLYAITFASSEPDGAEPGILRIRRSDGDFTRLSECMRAAGGWGCELLRMQGGTITWLAYAGRRSGSALFQRRFHAMPMTGGGVDALASHESYAIHESVQSSTHVYWAGYLDGQVLRAPLSGGPAELLDTTDGATTGRLLLHSGELIFASLHHPSDARTGEPGIWSVPVTGGSARRIVSNAFGVANDAVRIYPLGLVNDCLVYADNVAAGSTAAPPEFSIRIRSL
ncbi:MAG TPA: MopE-related protein [Sandaracinaceae bacterium LLY-WYZ-13_1]|nr:MopE-related protein [Sandaracinaceae bacterium LLY-WYZ-13_1]